MKVCLLTRYFDFRNAGIGRTTMEMFSGLIKGGHSVDKVFMERTSLYAYLIYTMFQVPIKARRLKDIDIYHAMTPMEGMWIPKNKLVVTFHDFIPYLYPHLEGAGLGGGGWKSKVGKYYFWLGCKLASQAKRIGCNSEQTLNELVEHFGVDDRKVKVIKWGIREDLRPSPKKDGMFRFGYLGQLDRRKRVDLLVDSFHKSTFDGKLVVGGMGVDEEKVKRLAEGDERIKFLGFIPDRELVDFYNSLDVFVFPTMIEGYGLPPVEAMACKIPVVVLQDAIIPWEVKSKCIMVEDLDYIFGNSNYLRGLIGSVDYENNYLWAKMHSWDRCVEEYLKLYEEVLSEG